MTCRNIDVGFGLTLPLCLPDIPDLLDKAGDVIGGIFSPIRSLFSDVISGTIDSLIKPLFEKLKLFLKDFEYVANSLLSKTDSVVKSLIDKTFESLSRFRQEVESTCKGIIEATQGAINAVIQKLEISLSTLINKIDKLKDELVQDVKDIIELTFNEVKTIMREADVIATGTVADFKVSIQQIIENLSFKWPWVKNECKVGIEGIPVVNLGPGRFYELLKCRTLKLFDEEDEISNMKVGDLQILYADLQYQAWNLACVARGTVLNADASLKTEAIEDWIKYGQLYKLWNQFTDETMAILDAINSKVQLLDDKIAQFEAKSAEIDQLTEVIVKTQQTANDAVIKANDAQNTANDAVSRANNAQGTANDAVNRANNAQNTSNNALDLANQINGRTQKISCDGNSTYIDAGNKTLVIQSDGNVVVYRDGGVALWNSGTAG
jgi:uncharacterized surface protein with fasciclin (FAS1) repeats